MFNRYYNDTVQSVIHTRLVEAGCFEVIGISLIESNGQLIYPKGDKLEERIKSSMDQLREYVRVQPINYGGVPYIKDTDTWPSISFVSSKLLRPKSQIYIIDSVFDKKISINVLFYKLADTRFAKQSLHMYVDDEKNPQSFQSLLEMINNKELWFEKVVKINDNLKHNYNRFNFLTLINKEDDELSFSNMFYYFFSNYSDIFCSLKFSF